MSTPDPVRTEAGDVVVELVQGDITAQPDIDAIVNAANAELRTGGGVAGAIHAAAGPGLADETRPMAPLRPGQAVITSGHDLPNEWVIHTLGPVYGRDEPADQYLTDCYRHSLELAESKGLRSVAFPAISTGAFGYPMDSAAEIALSVVREKAPRLDSVRRIRFVLHDRDAHDVHKTVLERLTDRA